MKLEQGVVTPNILIEELQNRTNYRGELREQIDFYQKSLERAKAVLSADRFGDVQTMCEVMKEAIIQKNPKATEFAEAFITHTIEGGNPQEFFSLEKNKQYEDLDITSLVTPIVQENLGILPLAGLFDLITSGVMEKGLPQIQLTGDVIEASPVHAKDHGRDIRGKETAMHPAIKTLFGTKGLWVSNYRKGNTFEERFTSLDNVAVLLIGDNWDEKKIKTIKTAIQQTVVKNYINEPGNNFDGTHLGKGHGTNKYYSEDQVRKLITFMQDFLPKSLSPLRFTSETVVHWPFDDVKKKS